MRRRTYSLRCRLTGVMLLVFVLGLLASGSVFVRETHKSGVELRERSLREQARELLNGIRIGDGAAPAVVEPPPAWAGAYARPDAAFAYTLFDGAGHAVARSGNLDAPLPRLTTGDGEFGPLQLSGPEGTALLAAKAPNGHVLVVARKDPDREALAETILEETAEPLLVLVAFMPVSLGLIWLVAGWSLGSLARAARDAAAITPGSPSARIASAGLPGELLPLVDAVNDALERLARAYEAERRFTADAAHELRTPLSVLNLRLQRAEMDGVVDWPAVRHDLAELGRLVTQLLDLARKEATARTPAGDLPTLDLGRAVREAAAAILALAERAGRTIEIEGPPGPLPIRGRAEDLRDMLRNLIENALVHGHGTIAVQLRRKSSEAILEVADEGPGVPPELQDVVFERFRKGRIDSPGAGLGLAIVRHVARAHRGDVRFSPGQGPCRIEVRLPLATPRSTFPSPSRAFASGDHRPKQILAMQNAGDDDAGDM